MAMVRLCGCRAAHVSYENPTRPYGTSCSGRLYVDARERCMRSRASHVLAQLPCARSSAQGRRPQANGFHELVAACMGTSPPSAAFSSASIRSYVGGWVRSEFFTFSNQLDLVFFTVAPSLIIMWEKARPPC